MMDEATSKRLYTPPRALMFAAEVQPGSASNKLPCPRQVDTTAAELRRTVLADRTELFASPVPNAASSVARSFNAPASASSSSATPQIPHYQPASYLHPLLTVNTGSGYPYMDPICHHSTPSGMPFGQYTGPGPPLPAEPYYHSNYSRSLWSPNLPSEGFGRYNSSAMSPSAYYSLYYNNFGALSPHQSSYYPLSSPKYGSMVSPSLSYSVNSSSRDLNKNSENSPSNQKNSVSSVDSLFSVHSKLASPSTLAGKCTSLSSQTLDSCPLKLRSPQYGDTYDNSKSRCQNILTPKNVPESGMKSKKGGEPHKKIFDIKEKSKIEGNLEHSKRKTEKGFQSVKRSEDVWKGREEKQTIVVPPVQQIQHSVEKMVSSNAPRSGHGAVSSIHSRSDQTRPKMTPSFDVATDSTKYYLKTQNSRQMYAENLASKQQLSDSVPHFPHMMSPFGNMCSSSCLNPNYVSPPIESKKSGESKIKTVPVSNAQSSSSKEDCSRTWQDASKMHESGKVSMKRSSVQPLSAMPNTTEGPCTSVAISINANIPVGIAVGRQRLNPGSKKTEKKSGCMSTPGGMNKSGTKCSNEIMGSIGSGNPITNSLDTSTSLPSLPNTPFSPFLHENEWSQRKQDIHPHLYSPWMAPHHGLMQNQQMWFTGQTNSSMFRNNSLPISMGSVNGTIDSHLPVPPVGYQFSRDPLTGHTVLMPARNYDQSNLWQHHLVDEPNTSTSHQFHSQVKQKLPTQNQSLEFNKKPEKIQESSQLSSTKNSPCHESHLEYNSEQKSQSSQDKSPINEAIPPPTKVDLTDKLVDDSNLLVKNNEKTTDDDSLEVEEPSPSDDLDMIDNQVVADLPDESTNEVIENDADEDIVSSVLDNIILKVEEMVADFQVSSISNLSVLDISDNILCIDESLDHSINCDSDDKDECLRKPNDAPVVNISEYHADQTPTLKIADCDPNSSIPIESKPVVEFIDNHGLNLLLDSIEEFANEGMPRLEKQSEQCPRSIATDDELSIPPLSSPEIIHSEMSSPNTLPDNIPANVGGLSLLCALAEQRFNEEIACKENKIEAESPSIKEEMEEVPKVEMESTSIPHVSKPISRNSPPSATIISSIATSVSSMDSTEIEVRQRMAELQRKYREKQQELAKLQPKCSKRKMTRKPGRPKKRNQSSLSKLKSHLKKFKGPFASMKNLKFRHHNGRFDAKKLVGIDSEKSDAENSSYSSHEKLGSSDGYISSDFKYESLSDENTFCNTVGKLKVEKEDVNAIESSSNEDSSDHIASSSSKRKPGRPKKHSPKKSEFLTETIVAKKLKPQSPQNNIIQHNELSPKSMDDEVSKKEETAKTLLYDEDAWSRRRSERIFLNDSQLNSSSCSQSVSSSNSKSKPSLNLSFGSLNLNNSTCDVNRKRKLSKSSNKPILKQSKLAVKKPKDITPAQNDLINEECPIELGHKRKIKEEVFEIQEFSKCPSSSDAICHEYKKDMKSCVVTADELKDNLRVLILVDGLFYAARINAIEPPDVYGVSIDGERGNRSHIYTQEEVLNNAILERKPESINALKPGTRVCAYWSQQYRCLYPGTIAKASSPSPFPEKDLINVEFDDGDSGKIEIDDVRLLPINYPIVSVDPNPIMTGKKRRRASGGEALSGADAKSVSSDCGSMHEDQQSICSTKVDKKDPISLSDAAQSSEVKLKKATKSSLMSCEKSSDLFPYNGKDSKSEMGNSESKVTSKEKLKKRSKKKSDSKSKKKDCDERSEKKKKHKKHKEKCHHRHHHRHKHHRKHHKKHRHSEKYLTKSTSKSQELLSVDKKDVYNNVIIKDPFSSGKKNPELTVKIRTNSGDSSNKMEPVLPELLDLSSVNTKSSFDKESPNQKLKDHDKEMKSTKIVKESHKEEKEISLKNSGKSRKKEKMASVENRSKIAAFLPAKQIWRWSGKSFKRPGVKGKAKKEFYKSITRGKETIMVGDSAVFLSTGRPHLPFIGRIEMMWESWGGNMVVKVKWFYHPEETKGGEKLQILKGALYQSPHMDENDVQTISHKCEVLSWHDYQSHKGSCNLPKKHRSSYEPNDLYYLAGSYDPTTQVLTVEPEVELKKPSSVNN